MNTRCTVTLFPWNLLGTWFSLSCRLPPSCYFYDIPAFSKESPLHLHTHVTKFSTGTTAELICHHFFLPFHSFAVKSDKKAPFDGKAHCAPITMSCPMWGSKQTAQRNEVCILLWAYFQSRWRLCSQWFLTKALASNQLSKQLITMSMKQGVLHFKIEPPHTRSKPAIHQGWFFPVVVSSTKVNSTSKTIPKKSQAHATFPWSICTSKFHGRSKHKILHTKMKQKLKRLSALK